MTPNLAKSCRALMVGVPDELKISLIAVLRALDVDPVSRNATSGADLQKDADVIFCDAEANVINSLRKTAPSARIIAVSRLAETDRWLDAIEAGADDYCALPFETFHLRWTLDRFLQHPSHAAA